MIASLVIAGAAFQAPMVARPSNQLASSHVVMPEVARVPAAPMMGATIRELRDRVGSVKNTRKITSAMV